MDRRAAREMVGDNVNTAILAAGTDISHVAQAADLSRSDLQSRLHGDTDFEVTELAQIGGLLRLSPDTFLEGVA